MAMNASKRPPKNRQLFADILDTGVLIGLCLLALCASELVNRAFGPLSLGAYLGLVAVSAIAINVVVYTKFAGAVAWLLDNAERLIPTPPGLQSGFRRLNDSTGKFRWKDVWVLSTIVFGAVAVMFVPERYLVDTAGERFFALLLFFAAIYGWLSAAVLLASVLAGIFGGKPARSNGDA